MAKKTYTLPRGPFVHDGKEITLDTVDRVFPNLHKSTRDDYLEAGLVAEVPPEALKAAEVTAVNPDAADPAPLDAGAPDLTAATARRNPRVGG